MEFLASPEFWLALGQIIIIDILLGVGFFMLNQHALNVGMLSGWPPWLTALGPNIGALLLAFGALSVMEYRHKLRAFVERHWTGRRTYA